MTITHVQDAHANSSSAASVSVTLSSAVGAGDFLAAAICLPSSATVVSVIDNTEDRWIRQGASYSSNGNAELWTCRGAQGGSTTVTVTFTGSTTAGVNVSEWAGVLSAGPSDQWSQNFGTSAAITPQTVTPRTTGDLVITVGSCVGGGAGAPSGGFTTLTQSGNNGFVSSYDILSGASTPSTTWTVTSSTWACVQACFLAGNSYPNPLLQFPETLVEVSTTGNFLAPIEGMGVWTSIGRSVLEMSLGPLGRQHELDRIQATAATIRVDNRDGSFNPWNTAGYLYNGGKGLKPMNPVQVRAAWDGVTNPAYYGYIQSVTPSITDVLNINADIACYDIMQMMSLKYLSNDNYAQLVIADGGANLGAYYRLGDAVGTYTVEDSSPNNRTGSLVFAASVVPQFGGTGAFLYDPNTSLDLTDTTKFPGGGFCTIDTTVQPPAPHDCLANASTWTIEMWIRYEGSSSLVPRVNTKNMALMQGFSASAVPFPSHFYFGVGVGITDLLEPLFNRVLVTNTGVELDVGTYTSRDTTVFDGKWHYLTFVQEPSTFKVYYDGILDVGVNNGFFGSVGPILGPSQLVFGIAPDSPIAASVGTNGFAGLIQDVALYTTPLTATQVANHYQVGTWFQQLEYGASVGAAPAGRLNKVLAVAGLPTSIMEVPYHFQTLLYDESNVVTTTSALNYIQTVSQTEPGLVFQLPTGFLAAYNRQYQYQNPTSTASQATFADSTGTIYYYEGPNLEIAADDLDTWNDIIVQSSRPGAIAQQWGPNQSAVAAQSASVYGDRTLQGLTSLQFEYDSDALAVAQNYISWYNTPIQRVTRVVLMNTSNGGANLSKMLGLGIYDRVTVEYSGQTPGSPFTQDALIEAIQHDVKMDDPSWVTTYQLSPYEILLNPIVLDVSTCDGPDVLTL